MANALADDLAPADRVFGLPAGDDRHSCVPLFESDLFLELVFVPALLVAVHDLAATYSGVPYRRDLSYICYRETVHPVKNSDTSPENSDTEKGA
jgi:hypothetical protein